MALRRLRQLAQFERNPRLLIAYASRRIVGLTIIGSSLLLHEAMFATDHIRALDGHPAPNLRYEIALGALLKMLFVMSTAFVGVDLVERIEDWANPVRGRARIRRTYLEPRKS